VLSLSCCLACLHLLLQSGLCGVPICLWTLLVVLEFLEKGGRGLFCQRDLAVLACYIVRVLLVPIVTVLLVFWTLVRFCVVHCIGLSKCQTVFPIAS
jgi:hypothetical protein